MRFLSQVPLELTPLIDSVTAPDRGAVATFAGLVRNHHAGREVTALAYSAYEPMAEQVCQEIVRETEASWPVRIALQHRLGDVPIGEAAVLVVASSAHRAAAFDAVRMVIDAVKSRVPIWKRERYADGSEAWVDPTAPEGVTPVRENR
ncbi:MAG: molybdenum cofactor biosynthesis protein MoaE [Gemmatimonadales bacterium]